MRYEMKVHVLSSPKCQLNKPTVHSKHALYPLPVLEAPFQTITLDWLKGFPRSADWFDPVLSTVDEFGKSAIIIPW